MTFDEMNDAIAEQLGWTFLFAEKELDCGATVRVEAWFDPHGCGMNRPNYSRNLNEMAVAEQSLLFSQRLQYYRELQFVLSRGLRDCEMVSERSCIMAQDYQRAEAFLRTVGKWKDDK